MPVFAEESSISYICKGSEISDEVFAYQYQTMKVSNIIVGMINVNPEITSKEISEKLLESKHFNVWYALRDCFGKYNMDADALVEPTDMIKKFVNLENSKTELEYTIPAWIKFNAKAWADDQISQEDYLNSVQHLVRKNIIVVPLFIQPAYGTEFVIPDWIKLNAGWWSEGKISDQEYATSIEYLVKHNMIDLE